ncbi:sensor histidine kinase [Paenibacillus sp. N4]|uniref:sensor histidine kinase n=1 Tax=Paenibacillus vietnamensis TaxID=2590547 RepID=UPI001CD160E6|nr:histidine kinase [Paenibacillus vietnamensis]MCA0755761.1 sensor histidine kinase [Paenibacillus vietnamensis]
MSIVRKIILGYVVIVFIPVIAFGIYYYNQIYGSLTQQFVGGRQKILEQAYSNLRADMVRIESVHRLLQYNPYVTDYLDGMYQTDSDSVYAHIRYISPLFTQTMFANPEIESVMIYKLKDEVFPITKQFLDRSELAPELRPAVEHLRPGKGVWIRREEGLSKPSFVYYQDIYNSLFTEKIGLLEIRVSHEPIRKFFEAAGAGNDWSALLFSEQGELLFTTGRSPAADNRALMKEIEERDADGYFITRESIVNQLHIGELGVRVVVTGLVEDVFQTVKREKYILIGAIAVLLIVLSVVYYYFASAIAKRILRLARHMRSVRDDNLKVLVNRQDNQDEIGFLTSTYNAMIQRMDELINNVHRAEIRNKEAAYKVLQAQIKPHFLYNTLETIRMLAEANDDHEVADISYWFGRLMRYSLSSQKDVTVLSSEIEMVMFYLNIHKMRLRDRLDFQFEILLETDKMECPRFLLQPLIENSVIHGISVLRPVRIKLLVEKKDEYVRIVIEDNGAGIPPEKLQGIQSLLARGTDVLPSGSDEGGLGLFNVSERIKAFYGGESRLELESEKGKGTTLTLYLLGKGEAAS